MLLALVIVLTVAGSVSVVPPVPQDPLLIEAYFSEHGHELLEAWGTFKYAEASIVVSEEELTANANAGYTRIASIFSADQKVTLLTNIYEQCIP